MGRKSKLTDDLIEQICGLLAEGHTDKDVYDAVGISHTTFYGWLSEGETATRGQKVEFLEAVTRARAQAKLANVRALQDAARGGIRTVVEKTVLDTETRLDRKGEPYEYRKEHTERSVTHHPVDWRAALEYLKRRAPDEWSEKLQHESNVHISIDETYKSAADIFDSIIADAAARREEDSISSEVDPGAENGAPI